MGFAFMEFEYDELPSIEGIAVTGVKGYLLPESFLSGFQLAVFAMILLFEYLRSHIGEKRLSEEVINSSDLSSIVKFLTTAQVEPSFVFIATGKD